MRASLSRSQSAAIALLLLLLVGFLAGVAVLIWRGAGETRERTELMAESAVRVVEAHVEWMLETSRQVLLRVDATLDDALAMSEDEAEASLSQAVESLPGEARLYVVAADGETLLTTDPDFRAIDIRDREYFVGPAGGETWHLSGLMVSRLNGQQIFTVSRRIERNGAFFGVAILSYSSELLRSVWSSLALDDQSTVSLVRGDGTLISRYPLPDGPVDLSNYVLFTDYLPAATSGVYDAVSPVDGIERVVAYRQLAGEPLVALASISRAGAYARFNQGVFISLALIIPITGALAWAVWWVVRLLRADALQRAALATALDRNTVLFREIHHRVKNNLQSVLALISLSRDIPPATKDSLRERIQAMVTVHEHIYRRDAFDSIGAADYIRTIVDKLVQSYGKDTEVRFDLADVTFAADQAMPLGLVLNEVVSNALKYAAPTDGKLALGITLAREDKDMVRLEVRDNGPGFDPESVHKNMGSRLIAALSTQLRGEPHYSFDNGMVFTLRFPVAPPAETAA